MVFVFIDKNEQVFIIHEDDNCNDSVELQNNKELSAKYESLTFRDIQRAKFYFLTNYENYNMIHHCYPQPRVSSSSGIGTDAPFNDYTQHQQNVLGPVGKRVNLSSMPKLLRWFYYGVIFVVITGFLIIFFHSIF